MYFYKVGQPPQIKPNDLPVSWVTKQSFQSFIIVPPPLSAPTPPPKKCLCLPRNYLYKCQQPSGVTLSSISLAYNSGGLHN